MEVFKLRDYAVSEYKNHVESFINTTDGRIERGKLPDVEDV